MSKQKFYNLSNLLKTESQYNTLNKIKLKRFFKKWMLRIKKRIICTELNIKQQKIMHGNNVLNRKDGYYEY